MFIYDVSLSKYVSINSVDISCHSYFQNNDSLSFVKVNNFSLDSQIWGHDDDLWGHTEYALTPQTAWIECVTTVIFY